MSVLHTAQDFYDLTLAYFTRAHADNVRHAEVFFDPQGHTIRRIPFRTVINGIQRAREDAASKLDITSELIMCFWRHLSAGTAKDVLQASTSQATTSTARTSFTGSFLTDAAKAKHPTELDAYVTDFK